MIQWFVITSTVCLQIWIPKSYVSNKNPAYENYYTQAKCIQTIRLSTSSVHATNEEAKPLCDYIGHEAKEIVPKNWCWEYLPEWPWEDDIRRIRDFYRGNCNQWEEENIRDGLKPHIKKKEIRCVHCSKRRRKITEERWENIP